MTAARSLISRRAGPEQREPYVVVVVEGDLDGHADVDVVWRAAHDVGHQPHVGLFLDLDDGDHVRGVVARYPRLVVDGERVHCGPTADRFGSEVLRQVDRADRRRRVHVVAAGLAAQEAQLAVFAPGPEELVGVVDARQKPEGFLRVGHCHSVSGGCSWPACHPRRACGKASSAGTSPNEGWGSRMAAAISSQGAATLAASMAWRSTPGGLRRITVHTNRMSSWVLRSGWRNESMADSHEACASCRTGARSCRCFSDGKTQSA